MTVVPRKKDASGGVPAKKGEGVAGISDRLAKANDPKEIVLWTQVRGEVLRQDQDVEDRRHRRWMEKVTFLAKPAMSAIGVGVGTTLVIGGHEFVGLFVLGAGFSWLAPRFTKAFFDKWGRSRDE